MVVAAFLTAGSTWDHFNIFDNTTLHISSFISLQFHVASVFYYIWLFLQILDILSVFSVTPKVNFVQLLVCISSADHW